MHNIWLLMVFISSTTKAFSLHQFHAFARSVFLSCMIVLAMPHLTPSHNDTQDPENIKILLQISVQSLQ